MQQRELIAFIEQTAPLHLAAPWDHSGVQVAAERPHITHLAVCLDPTPDAVREALALGADMILSHHPLVMQPRFLDRMDEHYAVARLLLCADVPLYAAHTSLDANPDGPVTWLARELDLRELAVLDPAGDTPEKGFGVVGEAASPMTRDALLTRLAPWLAVCHAVLAGPDLPQTNIRRIAVCPGSGSSLAGAAAARGADLLITGDVKYHTALESPISIIDMGHFLLEEEMMRRFAATLASALPVPVTFIPARDPLRALPSFPKSGGSSCLGPALQEDVQ